jgi:hypothetical protein
MKFPLLIVLVAGAVIGIAAVSSDAEQRKAGDAQDQQQDQPHAQVQSKDRMHDKARIQSQDSSKLEDEGIYGHELMSREELNQYRIELRKQGTAGEREQFQHEHEERMRERAALQHKDLVPPGQGPIYGGNLMSVEERNEYRERLRLIESDEEKTRFEAQHREEMQQRAQALKLEIEDAE